MSVDIAGDHAEKLGLLMKASDARAIARKDLEDWCVSKGGHYFDKIPQCLVCESDKIEEPTDPAVGSHT